MLTTFEPAGTILLVLSSEDLTQNKNKTKTCSRLFAPKIMQRHGQLAPATTRTSEQTFTREHNLIPRDETTSSLSTFVTIQVLSPGQDFLKSSCRVGLGFRLGFGSGNILFMKVENGVCIQAVYGAYMSSVSNTQPAMHVCLQQTWCDLQLCGTF